MWIRKLRKRMPYIIGIGVFVTLYVGGLFAQLSHLVDDGFQFSFGVIHSILANFTCGFQGVVIVALAYFGGGWYLVLRYRDKTRRELETDDRGFEIEGSGTYGTASLMGMEQARAYVEVESLSKTTGFIIGKFITDDDKTGLGKVVSVPPDGKRYSYSATGKPIMEIDKNGERKQKREKLPFNGNRHVMVIGPSGSGKSFSFSLPNIFQSILQGESVVVTDPKGELYAATSRFAEDHGYVVKILNLAWLNGSDAVDFLGEVQGDQIGIEAQSFANIVISNTENPNGGGDAAYTNGEKNLLTALVLFIITAPQHLQQNSSGTGTYPKTFGGVYELLCESLETLEEKFDHLAAFDPKNPALGPWSIFKDGSESFRGNLRTGLGNRLTVLSDDVVKNITGNKEIDLVLPGQTKCIYYVIMDDMEDTFKFLSSLFFTYLINRLVKYSRKQPGLRLPVCVNIIMDEFIAIGRLPDFDKKLATVRSAGISISMIFQNKPQLDAAYPDGIADTMIGNCSTILCLACNDTETAQFLSDRSGTATVALDQERIARPVISMGVVPTDVQHSYSLGKRAVLNPDEVIRLNAKKVLVAITSANLFMADKFPYTDIVNPDDLEMVNMYDHVPAWREKLSTIQTGAPVEEADESYIPSSPSGRPSLIPGESRNLSDMVVSPQQSTASVLPNGATEPEEDDDVVDPGEIKNPQKPDPQSQEKSGLGGDSLAGDSQALLADF